MGVIDVSQRRPINARSSRRGREGRRLKICGYGKAVRSTQSDLSVGDSLWSGERSTLLVGSSVFKLLLDLVNVNRTTRGKIWIKRSTLSPPVVT